MPERQVTIHSLKLIDYRYPELKIRAHVSSGTYIRTLAEDIGVALGTGAYCMVLRRLSVGQWNIAKAQTLEDVGVYS
jgi:tRNA pseudouridine55 synthase